MGTMQNILQALSQRLSAFSQWAFKQSQHLLILLQRFWAWYRSINWPEIPLTPLQWILLFYAVFSIVYVTSTPIFEASDERWHFGVIEHITETGTLPVQDLDNLDTVYRQEGSQPPLYYVLSSIIASPIDISDVDDYRVENPFAQTGNPGSWGNKNMFVHPVGGQPLQGAVLAVYVLRLVSVGMGMVTIFAIYQAALLVAPHRPIVAIVAAAITAFNPMFLFISGSVNNDNLVIMLNSLAIWLALMTMRDNFNLRRSLVIGFVLALASLTKLSALVLYPIIGLGALWVANRERDWRGFAILIGSIAIFSLAISGWWYLRNITLYGELFGTQMMATVANAGIERVFNIGTMFSEFQGFRQSYWGVFGGFNIITTTLYYGLVDFGVFVSMFGVVFLVAQLVAIRDFSYARRELTGLLFLLGIVLLGLVAFIHWTSLTRASQGRLLFPFMAAISPLLAVGFVEVFWWLLFLLSPPDRSFVRAGEAVPEMVLNQSMQWPLRILGLLAILIPVMSIAPQYAAPAPMDNLPSHVTPLYARYENVELIGYERIDRRYSPGESVRLVLYWNVLEQSEEDQSLAVALVDPEGQLLGSVDTYPGAGTLRTSTWEEGKIYADTYEIRLTRAVNGRFPFSAQVAWYTGLPDNRLEIVDAEDDSLDTVLLNIGALIQPGFRTSITPYVPLNDIPQEQRDFANELRLRGFAIDQETFNIQLIWETLNSIDKSYTTFVHITNEDGELVGQADVFPELPTRYWRFSETFVTQHQIAFTQRPLLTGDYSVQVGWYENLGDELPRLPIFSTNEDGEPVELTTYELFQFSVDANGNYVIPESAFEVEDADVIDEEADALEGAPEPNVPLSMEEITDEPLVDDVEASAEDQPEETNAEATEPIEADADDQSEAQDSDDDNAEAEDTDSEVTEAAEEPQSSFNEVTNEVEVTPEATEAED